MAIAFQCPQCRRRHRVNESMAGRRARCSCGAVLTVPAPPAPKAGGVPIVVHCPGCSRTHRVSAQMAGRSARCSCGTVLHIARLPSTAVQPLAPQSSVSSVLDEITAADLAPPATASEPEEPTPRRSEDEVLASYLKDESWKKPTGTGPLSGGSPKKAIIGGSVAIVVAIVWFFGGLSAGIIFFYPPVLFFLGLISLLRGLLTLPDPGSRDQFVAPPVTSPSTTTARPVSPAVGPAASGTTAGRPWVIATAIIGGLALAFFLGLLLVALFLGASKALDSAAASPAVEPAGKDYVTARAGFTTRLRRMGGSPQLSPALQIPAGTQALTYQSGSHILTAVVSPDPGDGRRHPAVVFLHGGFAFGPEDWTMAQPYRDAGYVVMIPVLRGENGQPGTFTLFYGEVDDVLAATQVLARLPYVDSSRIYVAGHSAGGTLAVLAAMSSRRYRAAASFSGTMNVRTLMDNRPEIVVFDPEDEAEIQIRSPEAFAASFQCPARLYYGDHETVLGIENERTADRAKKAGLEVQAVKVPGDHLTSVTPAMRKSIEFFGRQQAAGSSSAGTASPAPRPPILPSRPQPPPRGWVRYVCPEGRFAVYMPGMPKRTVTMHGSPVLGAFRTYAASYTNGSDIYEAFYIDILSPPQYVSQDRLLESFVKSYKNTITRMPGGAVLEERREQFKGIPAVTLKTTRRGATVINTTTRFFVAGDDIYSLSAGRAGSSSGKDDSAFFNSFEFLGGLPPRSAGSPSRTSSSRFRPPRLAPSPRFNPPTGSR